MLWRSSPLCTSAVDTDKQVWHHLGWCSPPSPAKHHHASRVFLTSPYPCRRDWPTPFKTGTLLATKKSQQISLQPALSIWVRRFSHSNFSSKARLGVYMAWWVLDMHGCAAQLLAAPSPILACAPGDNHHTVFLGALPFEPRSPSTSIALDMPMNINRRKPKT